MKIKYFLILLLFCIFLLNSFLYSASKNDKKIELETIKTNIKLKEKQIAKTKKKENIVSKDINYIKTKIKRTNKQIKSLKKNITKTKKKYKKSEQELRKTQNVMNEYKTILAQEIVLLYKRDDLKQTNMNFLLNKLFEDDSLTKEDMKNYAMKILLKHNEYMYKKTLKQESKILKIKKNLSKNQKQFERNRRKYQSKTNDLAKLQKEKKRILNNLRKRRKDSEKELLSLKASARKLQVLMNKLLKTRASVRGDRVDLKSKYLEIIATQGSIIWPVSGKIITIFGKQKHPILDTYLISNGIEISAPKNQIVKCVKSGKIIYTGKFNTYGNMIIIDHNDSVYTVYAYLESIKVLKDTLVVAGDIIGNVGFSPIRKVNSLYFEVRIDGIPVDPRAWLK